MAQEVTSKIKQKINPETVIDQYGADTLRLYEMFMGPLERVKPWSMQGVKGVSNFLVKSYNFFGNKDHLTKDKEDPQTLKLLHQTIKKVSSDIEELKFNTAISQLMIFTNHCHKIKSISNETAKTFALLLSPFAPHLGEELWQICGQDQTLAYASWPTHQEELTKEDKMNFPVQVNGKTKVVIEVDADISKDDLLELVKNHEKIKKLLDGKNLVKEIVVPKKIINLIIK